MAVQLHTSFGSVEVDGLINSFMARRTARRKEVDHGPTFSGMGSGFACRVALAIRAPGFASLTSIHPMANFNLIYSILKRTPASSKVLKDILDAQAAVNAACVWTHERLALVAPREGRTVFTLPFTRFGFASGPMTLQPDGLVAGQSGSSENYFIQGSSRVRNDAWNAHVVVAFVKYVSRMHPGLHFELRDEGGFVIPGSVLIRGGNVEVNREFLNRERVRALEVTGDPQAATPYVYAEVQGLAGNFFLDTSLAEYGEVPEIRKLGVRWQDVEAMSLSDLALLVVENATKSAVPAMA
ncbi:MAG: hypothetical protein JWO36_2013 [Myxococcales bacterium]|nr:hypothetical protein [Myxococcales bacterium]